LEAAGKKVEKAPKVAKKVGKDLAALSIPKSTGIVYRQLTGKWKVTYCFKRNRKHLGYFEDHTDVVAEYSSASDMTETELEARFPSTAFGGGGGGEEGGEEEGEEGGE
jgi:hypothetical protein